MPKRKLTDQDKQAVIDAKRAEIRASGQAEIIADLVVDDETDESGKPIVRETDETGKPAVRTPTRRIAQ